MFHSEFYAVFLLKASCPRMKTPLVFGVCGFLSRAFVSVSGRKIYVTNPDVFGFIIYIGLCLVWILAKLVVRKNLSNYTHYLFQSRLDTFINNMDITKVGIRGGISSFVQLRTFYENILISYSVKLPVCKNKISLVNLHIT